MIWATGVCAVPTALSFFRGHDSPPLKRRANLLHAYGAGGIAERRHGHQKTNVRLSILIISPWSTPSKNTNVCGTRPWRAGGPCNTHVGAPCNLRLVAWGFSSAVPSGSRLRILRVQEQRKSKSPPNQPMVGRGTHGGLHPFRMLARATRRNVNARSRRVNAARGYWTVHYLQ